MSLEGFWFNYSYADSRFTVWMLPLNIINRKFADTAFLITRPLAKYPTVSYVLYGSGFFVRKSLWNTVPIKISRSILPVWLRAKNGLIKKQTRQTCLAVTYQRAEIARAEFSRWLPCPSKFQDGNTEYCQARINHNFLTPWGYCPLWARYPPNFGDYHVH